MRKNKKGITLIEILLYIGLLSIFLFVLIDIFIGGINVSLGSQSSSAVEEDGQYIIAKFAYDINNAASITTPSSLGATTNSLVFVSNAVTYTYALTNNELTFSDGTNTYNLNGTDTNITSITFTRIGNSGGKGTIQMIFTLQSNVKTPTGNYETRNFEETAGLR